MSGEGRTIGRTDLLKVFLRSLLIQASWSFERMQSLGFAYAMLPVLAKLYPDREELESRLKSHQVYFNTQPYLSAFILGAGVRLEEERARGMRSDDDVAGMKESLMAPLGALGDSLFWAGLKPLAASLAVFLLLTGAVWAPLVYLVLYNILHLFIRVGVLFFGYDSAGDAALFVAKYNFTSVARLFKAIALCFVGAIIGSAAVWRPEFRIDIGLPGAATAMGSLVIVTAIIALMRRGASPLALMLALSALCIAAATIGVI